jgi:hypothetical protein
MLRSVLPRVRRRLIGAPTPPPKPTFRIELDYRPSAQDVPRWGRGRPPHPELLTLFRRRATTFVHTLDLIAGHADELAKIDREDTGDPGPGFDQTVWFGGLDACALYAFIRTRRPSTYLEIGSGVSTTFAHRARSDGEVPMRIVSIDPQPRREIDALCDEVVRQPLEEVDLGIFAALGAGDVLFFDGSHRIFMNSDVATFFLDVLPSLPPRVLIGMHDIFLPEDYPPEWAPRYYSEQYMLAAYLLGRGDDAPVVLSAHHVCTEESLTARWRAIWARISQENGYGSSLWLDSGR